MLLHYIKEQCTIIGTIISIFARYEYQTFAGNICHNHLIVAVNKTTMNSNTEKFIHDLICNSVLELIKTDVDVEELINIGLLKSIDNIPEINYWAENIIKLKCDEQFKMRIGPRNS